MSTLARGEEPTLPTPSSDLTYLDEFCGAGGSTDGAAQVPGLTPVFAADHQSR